MISDLRPVVKVNMRVNVSGVKAGKQDTTMTAWEEQCKQLLRQVFGDDCVTESLEMCTGGITNRLFRAKLKLPSSPTTEQVLIRVYGRHTECIIDREAELRNMAMLGERGLAGRLYGQFENGFVYSFIPGQPLSSTDLPLNAALIASELARWHTINPTLDTPCTQASVFRTTRLWMERVMGKLSAEQIQTFTNHLNRLEAKYNKTESLVFCHNDLLAPNIVKTGTTAVKFIDYEYASFNVRWFDIANHFCEYAGFECDWTRLPDDGAMQHFITAYISMVDVRLECVDALKAVKEFIPVAHLFWGLWALIQADLSEIDFDYSKYGRLRLEQARFD